MSSTSGTPVTRAIASATPLNGTAPLVVDFTGGSSTVASGTPSYLWDFKDGFTSTEENPSHTFMSTGDFLVSLTVTDGSNLSDTTTINITVSPSGSGCDDVAPPWTNADIGAVGITGDACVQDGVFQISASGADIWGTADEFHFVYQPMTGDGEIIARVMDIGNTHQWAKAGIMMRNNLAPGAAHAGLFISPNPNGIGGPGYSYQPRISDGAAMTIQSYTGPTLIQGGTPHYLRIVRSGNNFTAYVSSTNGNWTQAGTQQITMGTTIYVGLATTSHNDAVLTDASYSEVSVSIPTLSSKTVATELGNTMEKNNFKDYSTNEISIYPNPTSGLLNLNVRSLKGKSFTVGIYNFVGKLIRSEDFGTNHTDEITIDLETYNEAIYFINLETQTNFSKTQKVIKIK